MKITQERLMEVLNYNPETGIFTWKIHKKGSKGKGQEAGTIAHNGYIDVCIDYKKYGLHRLAFLYMTGQVPDNVDHKNGIKSDNKWKNLRPATVRENSFNYKGKSTKSGYRNVYYDKRGKSHWNVTIHLPDGTRKCIGYFKTPEEANQAAIDARMKYHGEYAWDHNELRSN